MASYNRVIIMGNLTKDPVIRRFGRNDTKVAFMCVAINEKRRTSSGEMVSSPVFVNVNAYDKLADLCERYCHKSQNILVEGRLQMDNRESPDGHQVSKLFLRAQSFKFLPSAQYRKDNEGNIRNNDADDKASETDIEEETPETEEESRW